MYPILACGVALLVAASRCVPRGPAGIEPRRLQLVQELRALTLSAGVFGSLLGVMHTVVALWQMSPTERPMALAQGLSESINNIGLALVLLATIVTVVAIARPRSGAALER